ncbi:MAG: hypothetical protein JXB32_01650 [Deltaproteobacteria bacterium]|nr:hypothetical protein [Deltaproteobacteria bacterium]
MNREAAGADFLHDHHEVIAAMDLLVVVIVAFRTLYVLIPIRHGRREIVHSNVPRHPTAE